MSGGGSGKGPLPAAARNAISARAGCSIVLSARGMGQGPILEVAAIVDTYPSSSSIGRRRRPAPLASAGVRRQNGLMPAQDLPSWLPLSVASWLVPMGAYHCHGPWVEWPRHTGRPAGG